MIKRNAHQAATSGGAFARKKITAIRVPLTRFVIRTTGVIAKRSLSNSL
jgi:hypothetical protein